MAQMYNVGQELTIMVSITKDGIACYGKRTVFVNNVEYNLSVDPTGTNAYVYNVADTLAVPTNPSRLTQAKLTEAISLVGDIKDDKPSFSGADGVKIIPIPNGLYVNKTATAVDTDLVAGNIRAGVNIFGVAGATNVVDTTTGDAAAANILAGKKAWVKGAEVTGTSTAVETASGDAVAADIVLGKKAWVNGVEITGTLVVT